MRTSLFLDSASRGDFFACSSLHDGGGRCVLVKCTPEAEMTPANAFKVEMTPAARSSLHGGGGRCVLVSAHLKQE